MVTGMRRVGRRARVPGGEVKRGDRAPEFGACVVVIVEDRGEGEGRSDQDRDDPHCGAPTPDPDAMSLRHGLTSSARRP
jgi:hypothetical protein